MCGITGIMNRRGEPVSIVSLKRMTAAVAHRGPDGEGFFLNGSVGLGHRRLSIIDLSSAGHQPMMSADKRFVLTYNGEIYNYQELRLQLEACGHRFRSQSDSEVLLCAFQQWGVDALPKFNGMFAFAIWDQQRKELFLARDRYGIKPLYLYQRDGLFLFASEIKAILAHQQTQTGLDREGLYEYLSFQNFFTDRTLFQGIRLFPAGSYLRVGFDDNERIQPVAYWDFHFEEPAESRSEAAYLEELDHLFRQAVFRHMVSDVELGTYLSGGMDSGSITAMAASQQAYIKSFTCGFDLRSASGIELGFDEREQSEYLSYLFKTEHYEMVLKAGDMERIIPRLVHHLEEPRVGQSYPNFYMAQLAGKFVKVVLSGTAGDELFGGYPWRYYRAVMNDNFEHYLTKYFKYWQRLIPLAAMKQVFRPIWHDVAHVSAEDIFRSVFKVHSQSLNSPEDYINHSLYFEAKTFLHGLLVVEDKLSMAVGLESRTPFLDNDLVDFATKLPVRFKLCNLKKLVRLNENEPGNKKEHYFQKTNDGKILLRKAMSRYIPNEVTEAVKKGFSAPDASWFRGESMNYVQSRLMNGKARLYEVLDENSLKSLIQEHLDGKKNHRLLIWSLLNLEEWLHQFG